MRYNGRGGRIISRKFRSLGMKRTAIALILALMSAAGCGLVGVRDGASSDREALVAFPYHNADAIPDARAILREPPAEWEYMNQGKIEKPA